MESVDFDDLLESIDLNEDEGVLKHAGRSHAAEQQTGPPLTGRTAAVHVDDVWQTPVLVHVAVFRCVRITCVLHVVPQNTYKQKRTAELPKRRQSITQALLSIGIFMERYLSFD